MLQVGYLDVHDLLTSEGGQVVPQGWSRFNREGRQAESFGWHMCWYQSTSGRRCEEGEPLWWPAPMVEICFAGSGTALEASKLHALAMLEAVLR